MVTTQSLIDRVAALYTNRHGDKGDDRDRLVLAVLIEILKAQRGES